MGTSVLENAYAERVNGIIKNEYSNYREIKYTGKIPKPLNSSTP